MRQQAPGCTGAHQPAQRVEHLAQVVGALRGLRRHQGEVGDDEGPLLVGDIGSIRLSDTHDSSLPNLATSA
jgi:hypothetical protein